MKHPCSKFCDLIKSTVTMSIETGKFTNLGQVGRRSINDQLLTAIARSAEDLTTGRGWPEGVNALMEDLGRITDVSRVWIFQTLELTEDYIIQDYTFEWAAAPAYAQIGLPLFSQFKTEINQPGYRKMIESRKNGEYQKVIIGKLQPSWIKRYLKKQKIKSMLTIPITVEGKWWGTLGFDDCEREYNWSDAEIALLRTAGFLISSAVLRDSLSAKKRQLDILKKITAFSAWQFDIRRGHLWCTSEIFSGNPGKTENFHFTLKQFLKMVHAEDRKNLICLIREFTTKKQERLRCDIRLLRECGDYRWVEVTGEIEKSEDRKKELIAGIVLDITTRKDAEERLRQEAITDPLTGLINRRKLESLMREQVNQYSKTKYIFSLLMVDIDFFKKVNDTYGHKTGDDILCHFAMICQDCLRKDDYLSRVGGEEFAILLPKTNEIEATAIANRIQKGLREQPYLHKSASISYTVSIGCASLRDEYTEPAQIYDLADSALYLAKKAGRNQVMISGSNDCAIIDT